MGSFIGEIRRSSLGGIPSTIKFPVGRDATGSGEGQERRRVVKPDN